MTLALRLSLKTESLKFSKMYHNLMHHTVHIPPDAGEQNQSVPRQRPVTYTGPMGPHDVDVEMKEEPEVPPMIAISNEELVVVDTLASIIQQHKQKQNDAHGDAKEELKQDDEADSQQENSNSDSYDLFTPVTNDDQEEQEST
eukprot:257903_1